MLLTGIWWSSPYRDSYNAYITTISRLYYVVRGVGHTSAAIADFVKPYTRTEEVGENMVRFPHPIFTDQIKLYGFYVQSTWNTWNYGHNIWFNMEVFGCENYDIEEVHCDEGWFSTKADCLKAVEFPTPVTFDEAVTKCEELGGKLIEPMNDILQADMEWLLKNHTGNETRFWIGDIPTNVYQFHQSQLCLLLPQELCMTTMM